MKKQVIRLTEGDLHRIIENSVKKCLNELAPETYWSAAQKSRIRANDVNRPRIEREFNGRRGRVFQNYGDEKLNITKDDEKNRLFGNYDGMSLDALRGYTAKENFNAGKRQYNNGRWRNRLAPQRTTQVTQQPQTPAPQKKRCDG